MVNIQSKVVAAAFRLRQSTQAEACGYKIPPVTEGLFLYELKLVWISIGFTV